MVERRSTQQYPDPTCPPDIVCKGFGEDTVRLFEEWAAASCYPRKKRFPNYHWMSKSQQDTIMRESSRVAKRKKSLDEFEEWVALSNALDTELLGCLQDRDIGIGLCSDHGFHVLDGSIHDQVGTEGAGNHVAADIGC